MAASAMVLMLAPWMGMAQAASGQTSDAEPPLRVIAPEDQPTKEQLARMFEAMRLKEQMAAVMKQMPAMMQQQVSAQLKSMQQKFPGTALSADQRAAFDKMMKKYMDKAFNLYPADEMIADIGTIYQKHLSREDVDAYIAFYQSPAGQHLLDISPVIMKEYMPLVMSRMQERTEALTDEMIEDFGNFAKAVGVDPNSPMKN
jgi:hypothetical protein